MARGSDRSQPAHPRLRVPLQQALNEFHEQADRGREIAGRQITSWEDLKAAQNAYYTWVEYVAELIRRRLASEHEATQFAQAARMAFLVGGPPNLQEDIQELREDVGTHLRRVDSLVERLPLFAGDVDDSRPSIGRAAMNRRVFVVHGHDKGPRDAAARLLTKLKLEPVILEEQANQGRTIIEKFEANVDVAFAVVVMTQDDLGKAADDPGDCVPRARQNVVLELGFFIGLLGRARVAALVVGHIELPSDVDGVLYVPYDETGGWRWRLATELRAAGLAVDMNLI